MLWIKSGTGIIEVDFVQYDSFENRVIFLSPGQPIKFLFGQFDIFSLEFTDEYVRKSPDYRVLFKHLISLGYIDFSTEKQIWLESVIEAHPREILDISANQWFWQNPFNANRDEYNIIFDLKEVIDERFKEHLQVEQFTQAIQHDYYFLRRLVKDRIGLTIKNLAQRKLLLESQKEIALTDKSMQEISIDLGFRDASYFNKFFKNRTNYSPSEFRKQFADPTVDHFIGELCEMIRLHHPDQKSTSFYAAQSHMSIKTLSRKVQQKLRTTVGDLVKREVIRSAKTKLSELSIKETAWSLGFKEANHFSTYFKKNTGLSPSEFKRKKYHS